MFWHFLSIIFQMTNYVFYAFEASLEHIKYNNNRERFFLRFVVIIYIYKTSFKSIFLDASKQQRENNSYIIQRRKTCFSYLFLFFPIYVRANLNSVTHKSLIYNIFVRFVCGTYNFYTDGFIKEHKHPLLNNFQKMSFHFLLYTISVIWNCELYNYLTRALFQIFMFCVKYDLILVIFNYIVNCYTYIHFHTNWVK